MTSSDLRREKKWNLMTAVRHEYKSTRAHVTMLINVAVPRNVNNDLFKLDNVIAISTI